MGGPITLLTTKFINAGCTLVSESVRVSQVTADNAAGGVTSASSETAPAPTAPVNAFAADDASCTAVSSSTGPSSAIGSATSIVASVLVPAVSPSPAFIGTPATTRSGNASLASRYCRTACA